jgi:predicted nuclease of restriction endonuclease-like RecB superfamily
MNVFILVEGKTEKKIYPKWLAQLVPHLTKVDRPALVSQNNYCLISGNGYPSLFNYLEDSINEVNHVGKFDFFVVVADADDKTVEEREFEIRNYLIKNKIKINTSTNLVVILQRCCFETWLLGNSRVVKKNPQDIELRKWIKHFNVSINDPELMLTPTNYIGSVGNFHKMYLKKMLAERRITYNETQSNAVSEPKYLTEMIHRFEQTQHIATFGKFLNFCKKLNQSSN